MAPPRKEEVTRKNMKTKVIYHFVDREKDIDQKSREVFKTKDEEIHFPIGFDGGPRYKNVERFVYRGFKGKLPIGVGKSAVRGLGFTKVLRPLMDYLEEHHSLSEVVILKEGRPKLERSRLILTEQTLVRLYPVFKNQLDVQKEAREQLATEQLHTLFPTKVKAPAKKYVRNSVYSALSTWSQSTDDFSDRDKTAIRELFEKLTLTEGFLDLPALLTTRQSIEKKYIEEVVAEFEKLMQQTTETRTLEKRWQSLLGDHSWIFSYIFSLPVMLKQDEAYVGGKTLSNQNGKVTDFLVMNELTENVAFLEIKTHKTKLLGAKRAYRGNDVFSVSHDLTGAVAQVLNQRDEFQKHYATHRMNSDGTFETLNSRCVVLMGMVKALGKKEVKSFELFRSNSKDVEIITFDELLARIRSLMQLITQEEGSTKD